MQSSPRPGKSLEGHGRAAAPASAWRESPLRDADYRRLREHFSEPESVNLTRAIGMINFWNRWAVGFRSQHPLGMDKRLR